MKMFALSSFLILLVTSTSCSYHFRCPVKSQRPLRASAYCTRSLRSEYMCLYDTNTLLFSEQCNKNPDYATRGEKYVLSGSLRNVDCSSNRYQPFTLWSNVSGECLYQKTMCEGEGQVFFNNGSLISDRACRCDFTKGYKFIQQPKQNCFCIPSEEDCSCYISTCDIGFTLSSDYECVGEDYNNHSKCPALQKKSDSLRSRIVNRNNGEGVIKSFNKAGFYIVVVICFVICSLLLLVIVIVFKLWQLQCIRLILVMLHFAELLASFVIVLVYVEHDLNTVAIGVSLLVISTALGSLYVVYSVTNHQLVEAEPPNVYDEHYELQIYKFLKSASEGDIEEIKRIIYQKYIDINDTNYDTRSALHLAACEGHYHAVAYLLKNKAGYLERKDRCLGHTVAEDAAWYIVRNDSNAPTHSLQEVIDLLKKHERLQKYKCSFKDRIVIKLMRAAEYGDVSVLQSLHDEGTDMNLSDNDGRTALHAAVERNQEKVIQFLIDVCKVSPFQRWRGQRPGDLITPQLSKPDIAEQLRNYAKKEQLEKKPDGQKKEQEKNENEDIKIVRILNSALRGDIRLMRAYKEAGYNMSVSDYDKRTALHIAVNNNQEHVVEFLLKDCRLDKEANTAKDRWGKTPFETAMKEGTEHIVKLFRDYCPYLPNTVNVDEQVFTLFISGEDDEVKKFKRLYESGDKINVQNSSGINVWNLSADKWITDAIQHLKSNEKRQKGVIVTCKKEISIRQTVK